MNAPPRAAPEYINIKARRRRRRRVTKEVRWYRYSRIFRGASGYPSRVPCSQHRPTNELAFGGRGHLSRRPGASLGRVRPPPPVAHGPRPFKLQNPLQRPFIVPRWFSRSQYNQEPRTPERGSSFFFFSTTRHESHVPPPTLFPQLSVLYEALV